MQQKNVEQKPTRRDENRSQIFTFLHILMTKCHMSDLWKRIPWKTLQTVKLLIPASAFRVTNTSSCLWSSCAGWGAAAGNLYSPKSLISTLSKRRRSWRDGFPFKLLSSLITHFLLSFFFWSENRKGKTLWSWWRVQTRCVLRLRLPDTLQTQTQERHQKAFKSFIFWHFQSQTEDAVITHL